MLKFAKRNKALCVAVFASVLVVLVYVVSYGGSEWFPNAGLYFTILYQLSLAVISSFIFYLLQTYLPQEKKNQPLRKFIQIEYAEILQAVRFMFENLSERYIGERKSPELLTDSELKQIASSFKNGDELSVAVLFQGNITAGASMYNCIEEVTKRIDVIMNSFSEPLNADEVEVLFNLAHGKMRQFFNGTNMLYAFTGLSGDQDGEKFIAFKEYKELYIKLLLIAAERCL